VHVTLPLLTPTLLIAALIRALDAFRIFDLPYVLTGGGPADSTTTLSLLTYQRIFTTGEVGLGSSLAVLMLLTEILIAVGFGIFLIRRMRMTSG
jgi:ABC-type sugar transport system permease subunit